MNPDFRSSFENRNAQGCWERNWSQRTNFLSAHLYVVSEAAFSPIVNAAGEPDEGEVPDVE